jgi:hypothetical protein
MRLVIVALLAVCLGCASTPERVQLGAWLGESEPMTWYLPVGTVLSMPSGQEIEITAEAVMMSANKWMWHMRTMELQSQLIQRFGRIEKHTPPTPGVEM